MYQGPSPIFDVPEFPPLRRVKPLPKRRRTSINVPLGSAAQMVDMNTGMGLGMNMNMAMAMGMGMNIGMGMVGSMSDLLEYQRGMTTTTAGTASTLHGNHNPASLSSVGSTATPASTPSGTISTSSTTSSPNSPSSTTQPYTPTSSLPSYYMPMSMSVPLSMSMFNNVGMGMQDLFRMGLGSIGSIMSGGNISGATTTTTNSNGTSSDAHTTTSLSHQIPMSLPLSLQHHPLSMSEYPGGFAVPVGPADEDDHGDGDYVDHLQHPGNTKKRKVPAANGHGHSNNHGGSHHGGGGYASSMNITGGNQTYVYPYGYTQQLGDVGDDDPGGDGDGSHSSTPQAQNQGQGTTPTSNVAPLPSTPGGSQALTTTTPFMIHKNKVSPATLAGLQHKELLKTRKRQLAAVLGALSHGDTLALDQALSARYIGVGLGTEEKKGVNVSSGTGKENLPLSIGHTYGNEREKRRRSARRRSGEESFTSHSPSPSPGATPNVRAQPLGIVDANTESNDDTTDQNGTNALVLRRSVLPSDSFTFICPSLTSDRLVSTREEVTVLHARFEAELSRQAAKAAEAATARQQAQAQQAQQQAHSGQGRGSKRVAGRKSDSGGNSTVNNNNVHGNGNSTTKSHSNSDNTSNTGGQGQGQGQDGATPTSNTAPPPLQKTRTKNKKRSALANASNPHHLRNYVPSRLPYSSSVGHGSGGGYGGYTLGPPALGLLSPLPVRFLTAQITSDPKTKGRRKSRNTNGNSHSTPTPANGGGNGRDSPESPRTTSVPGNNNTNTASTHSTIPLTLPEDEWICPLCEYYLFYGDDAAFRRAIKWRKKILNRRRRARERAAAAASGTRLAGAKGGGGGGNVTNAGNNNNTTNGDEYDDSSNADGDDAEGYFEDGDHVIDQEYHEHFRDREKDGVGGGGAAEHQQPGHGQKTRK